MKNEELWRRLRRELKTPSTTFRYPSNLLLHYHFALSFFYPPPTFPFLPSLQKQRTLPNSRRGGGLPRPLPRFSPLSQTPPTRTIPRPAPPQFKIHRQRRSPQFFIFHFSFFIIFATTPAITAVTSNLLYSSPSHHPNSKFAPSAPPQFFILHFSFFILPHHRHSSLSLAPHYQKSKFAPQVKQGCFNSGRTKSLCKDA